MVTDTSHPEAGDPESAAGAERHALEEVSEVVLRCHGVCAWAEPCSERLFLVSVELP